MREIRRRRRNPLLRSNFSCSRLAKRIALVFVILFGFVNNLVLLFVTRKYDLPILSWRHHSAAVVSNDNNTFSTTRFTSHAKQLVELYDFHGIHKCDNEFIFTVDKDQKPKLTCVLDNRGSGINDVSVWWCRVLQEVFASDQTKTLPYNVSFGVSTMDYLGRHDQYSCIASSAPDGKFSLTNFHEVYRQSRHYEFIGLPWDERKTIPIWRGTPWVPLDELDYEEEDELYNQVLTLSPRLKAVDWSIRHPDLLDARVHQPMEFMEFENASIWKNDSSTGLYKLLETEDYIPEDDYYVENQVTLVLCGLGASFRTSVFLSTGTAVVLQECKHKEWFAHMLRPFYHYIPLSQDLSDLSLKLKWIRDNPEKVQKIAEQGRKFYMRYLSFRQNKQHIYEFVYRLALARHEYVQSLTPEERTELNSRFDIVDSPQETISLNDGRVGNVEELQVMCRELLSRAGNSEYGYEPWRGTPNGLKWITNDCDDQADSVLGNHLSRWYMIRAVAADAGISVEMTCDSAVTNRIQTNLTPADTPLDGRNRFSWRNFCEDCAHDDEGCKYPHVLRSNGLEKVRSVILSELRSMAYDVISDHPGLVKELDDVTIHLRIGDIGRQDHTLYGLVPFRAYKSLIPRNATSIGIVTAPFKQRRQGWGAGDPELNEAVATAARTYLQDEFPNARVTIRNDENETLDMVYTRLILTNRTICGPSTFCVFPAIASLGEAYITQSPLFGGYPTWLTRVQHAFPNVHYVYKRYYRSIDLYELSTTDIVNKLKGNRARSDYQIEHDENVMNNVASRTPLLQTKANLTGINGLPPIEKHECRHYDGILHIQHGDQWAAGTAMFFMYVINFIQYAEEFNLLPWIHLDDFSERIYDAKEHGKGSERSFTVPSRLQVTHDCGEDQICAPKQVTRRNETITVMGNGVWESYFEPVSSFSLDDDDNSCYLPYLTFTDNDAGRMHYGWQKSVRAWHYIESVRPKPREGHLHKWYSRMRRRGADIVQRYYRPKPWLVKAIDKANPSEQCLSMHVRFTDKSGGRDMIGVDSYRPYAIAYAKAVPNGKIFLASDSSETLRQIRETWPTHVVERIIMQPSVLLSGNETGVFDIGEHHRTNTDVLVDVYAMAKCDAFLHGHSSVSESVVYVNIKLDECSVDLEDHDRPTAKEFRDMFKGDKPRCG